MICKHIAAFLFFSFKLLPKQAFMMKAYSANTCYVDGMQQPSPGSVKTVIQITIRYSVLQVTVLLVFHDNFMGSFYFSLQFEPSQAC